MKRLLMCLCAVVTMCMACTAEDDANQVVIFVSPNTQETTAGDKIYFDITARTINQELIRIEAMTFDKAEGSTTIFSAEPKTQKYSHRLIYDVPNYHEDQSIEFTFVATDNLGNVQDMHISVMVHSNSSTIEELTGVSLYSPRSTKNDAFSFRLMQSISSKEVEGVDIYVVDAEEGSESLSGTWASGTGLRFCKANNFNYASASEQSVTVVYANSVTNPTVSELSIDDIILVGDDKEAYAVIRIANIYDAEGVEDDRYDISIKSIKTISTEDIPAIDEQ